MTPDGQQIVTGSNDGTTRFWDIDSDHELRRLPTGGVREVAFTPHGHRLIIAQGGVTVWDLARGQELFSLKGLSSSVWSVAVTPDEQRIVTGSEDGTARVWDAVTGRQLLILKGHSGWVCSVAVTPDGQRIITGGKDGTVKIWEAASPEQVASWTSQDQEVERRLATWQWPSADRPALFRIGWSWRPWHSRTVRQGPTRWGRSSSREKPACGRGRVSLCG